MSPLSILSDSEKNILPKEENGSKISRKRNLCDSETTLAKSEKKINEVSKASLNKASTDTVIAPKKIIKLKKDPASTLKDSKPSAEKRQKVFEAAKPQFNFIYDQYTEARGAPNMLEITCRKCNAWVMDYQKDGVGNLLRCYADRIYHPSALREKIFTQKTVRHAHPLLCGNCQTLLAEPFIYHRRFPKPESRPAYSIIKIQVSGSHQRVPAILIQTRKN